MRLVDYVIERLENSLKRKNDGHVDLSKLPPEQREKSFVQFGEGNVDLTRLLKVAYEHDVESMFCCSGHSGPNGYVVFKVNEENLKYLQDVGKVLSKHNVVTNFEEHYLMGKRVAFSGKKSSDWFGMAADVMENIQEFDTSNPSIYYHEQMWKLQEPLSYTIKRKMLELLKKMGNKVETLPETHNNKDKNKIFRDEVPKVSIEEKESYQSTKKENEISITSKDEEIDRT